MCAEGNILAKKQMAKVKTYKKQDKKRPCRLIVLIVAGSFLFNTIPADMVWAHPCSTLRQSNACQIAPKERSDTLSDEIALRL